MRRRLIFYLTITFSIAIVDIVTKLIVQKNFALHESHQILGNFFKFTYILNYGGVFGSRLGSNVFYLISAIVVVLLVIFFLYREFGKNKYVDLSLFIVLGGAIGNLFDRIRMGAVVDFLDFNFLKIQVLGYQFDRWPTFNIADAAVTVGMILLVATVLFGLGTPKEMDADADYVNEE
ncbi:MAG: signal peptidase II [candidate division Zixibacteria bacterium]|nr:signal peptidase II [candidate division Zixibacteria bacterium]